MITDRNLRDAVKLLSKRVDYLCEEIKIMTEKHPEGCKCRLCKPRANPFIRSNNLLDGES